MYTHFLPTQGAHMSEQLLAVVVPALRMRRGSLAAWRGGSLSIKAVTVPHHLRSSARWFHISLCLPSKGVMKNG